MAAVLNRVLRKVVTRRISAASLIVPLQGQQLRCRYTINRPMKPKDAPLNPLFEDPALHVLPEREEYEELWFHIKGYDFVPVESYTKYLISFLKEINPSMERTVMPPQTWAVHTFKPRSEIEHHHYEFKTSHRIIKVKGLANNITSLIIDMATRNLPAGVELSLMEPSEELTEFRYVPDADIIALQKELSSLNAEKYM